MNSLDTLRQLENVCGPDVYLISLIDIHGLQDYIVILNIY